MLQTRVAAFSVEKGGSAPHEWEDGVLGDGGDPRHGRRPRFVVADGATEAYDSIRWVDHLVSSFADHGGTAPEIDPDSMHRWFETVQAAWVDRTPSRFANVYEERKAAEGSFATFLGCELRDAGGPAASWRGVVLGDTVLFHVRRRRLLVQFPPLAAEEFGVNPDGVHTAPAALPMMMARIRFAEHGVQAGDLLFLATDALAEWIVRARVDQGDERVWGFLSRLVHPDGFTRFVRDSRAARVMRNDDVTLLRVLLTDADPEQVVVSL